MTLIDVRDVPADQTSRERLQAAGFDYRVVDLSDPAAAVPFQRAVGRGFLGEEQSEEALAHGRKTLSRRRTIGVFEQGAAPTASPVGTIDSWVTPLTVPGGEVGMWAISGVTVAATHRRRGIARSLLEGELRAARAAGVPVAGLTVSEATIYGRYGFGSALPALRFTVDTRRAGWGGHEPAGRLEYRDREGLVDDLAQVHDAARRTRSGRIPGWTGRWEGLAGLAPGEADRDKVRGVRHLDESGAVRGALVYTLEERPATFRFSLRVRLLVAETAEARASLWRFALQHDLVDEVTADLQAPDDPLPWLVTDPRGVTQEVHDHGWLRILDLPTALSSRTYSTGLDATLRVTDPLGFTSGVWRLRVDRSGRAQVERVDQEHADVTLGVAALSALYAGGVRAGALHGAGLLQASEETVADLDRAFLASPAPSLDIWY
ncbi:GNAT family N-acetyltransferase [Microbacterium sp. 179-I 3D4 NHS]|uniref:GNAT family N-acetyltransferase n=1 Tax=Microbacterium sp. 179-I 3D4 NHS TaxID=3142381 RepID=UPI0039A3BDF7